MATKTKFAQEVQLASVEFSQLAARINDLQATYFDRGYNSGGNDQIAASDVASVNTGSTQIADFVTLAQQLNNFLSSASVIAADYSATLNKVRTDI